ncbi:MAG: lipid A biosynthesis lauroyl acyltransferase, partial [Pseudomonadota bacterium]
MSVWRRKAYFKFLQVRYRLEAALVFGLQAVIKRLPATQAINVMTRFARMVGPRLPRQKVVMDNLTRAFPEKSEPELQQIAREMWGHMGAMVAEYVFLDQLFDFNPDTDAVGRVEVVGEDIFRRLHAEDK